MIPDGHGVRMSARTLSRWVTEAMRSLSPCLRLPDGNAAPPTARMHSPYGARRRVALDRTEYSPTP